jgi:hypothetical protein
MDKSKIFFANLLELIISDLFWIISKDKIIESNSKKKFITLQIKFEKKYDKPNINALNNNLFEHKNLIIGIG